MTTPILLTTNPKKHIEVQTLVGFPVEPQPPSKYIKEEEWKTRSHSAIVTHVFNITGRPVLKENVYLNVDSQIFAEISDSDLSKMIGKRATAVIEVYVCREEGVSSVFANEITGAIVEQRPSENPLSFGWDNWFVPDGYSSTLGQLGGQKIIVNFRAKPYARVAQMFSNGAPESIFESHITVEDINNRGAQTFKDDCTSLGLKAILIELESGNPVNGKIQYQTGHWAKKPMQEVITDTQESGKKLIQLGYKVVRLKVEAVPVIREGAVNCPIEDSDVSKFPEKNYFEFHIKIEIPFEGRDAVDAKLVALCKTHGAHLSRNAFKKFDGFEHRFITMRIYKVGHKTAYARVDALVDDCLKEGLKVVQVQREYAVWDTNVEYDKGWI